jgi:glutathione synthase/RimK-type ligase-like ATP-grasp enzyme
LIVIGMLHHVKDPRKVQKSYAFAAVAKAEGAELIYFTLRDVDFVKHQISGYIYKNGSWHKTTANFPDVIYNTGSPKKFARRQQIFAKLKQEIPFTTSALGNKMIVYNRLLDAGEFIPYLIPTEPLISYQHLISYMKQYNQVIVKPINGHRGIGVIYIKKSEDMFHLLDGKENYIFTLEQLDQYISVKIEEEKLLIQPYINCKTQSGYVFDFRLHVQKNGKGEWVNTAIYPRIGAPGCIVSNIFVGGSTNKLEPFLEQEFGNVSTSIKQFLETFALRLANHLDKLQYQQFEEKLDEIGIDVGLDINGKYWLFEVNWRPGCPPAFDLELDVVKNTIHYAMYLARAKEFTQSTEK